jgi:hypothetical protein
MRIRRLGAVQGIILSAAFANLFAATRASAMDEDSALPLYAAVSGISCNLRSVGTDTLNDPMDFFCLKD